MAHETLTPTSVHPTVGYSHAVRNGNMLIISGQVAQDKAGNTVAAGDFEGQARQVFENLRNICEEFGGAISDIAKITVFLTDPRNIDGFRTVRNQFMGEPFPASTLLIIDGLAKAEWMIEVEATAFIG